MWHSGIVPFLYEVAVVAAETEGGEGGSAASPSPYPMWIMLAGVIAIMYLFMIRPQQKREKERQEMLNAVKKGDRVVTNGGIFGTVIGTNEKHVVLRISDDPVVKIELVRQAVAKIVNDSDKESDKGGK